MGREQPIRHWSTLLSSVGELDGETLAVLSELSSHTVPPVSLGDQLARVPHLDSSALLEVLASDSRPEVRIALLDAPRLPFPQRLELARWAQSLGLFEQLSDAFSQLPYRQKLRLYLALADAGELRGVSPVLLARSACSVPAYRRSRLGELLDLSMERDDVHLRNCVLRPLTGIPLPEVLALMEALPPAAELELLVVLVGDGRLRVTLPRSRRIVELSSTLDPERLEFLTNGEFMNFSPSCTPRALEVLAGSTDPLALRIAAHSRGPLPENILCHLLAHYPVEHFYDLLNSLSVHPSLWGDFIKRSLTGPGDRQRFYLDTVFTDAVNHAPSSPELSAGLELLTLALLDLDRSDFWNGYSAARYVFEAPGPSSSWWEQAAPTHAELSTLLDSAYESFTYVEENKLSVPDSTLERIWDLPGAASLIGHRLGWEDESWSFRNEMLSALALYLQRSLGTNVRSWEVALALVDEFTGSPRELVAAARSLC